MTPSVHRADTSIAKCKKCQGELGVRIGYSSQGKVLEEYCLCGYSKFLVGTGPTGQ